MGVPLEYEGGAVRYSVCDVDKSSPLKKTLQKRELCSCFLELRYTYIMYEYHVDHPPPKSPSPPERGFFMHMREVTGVDI